MYLGNCFYFLTANILNFINVVNAINCFLLNTIYTGYGVIWEIARVKQGSALQLSGWVTACVMPKLALVWPWFSYF